MGFCTQRKHVVASGLWTMEQGKVHTPPAWYTASLKHNWNAPKGMPSNWLPTVLHFRVDETTFAQIAREMREEKRTATPERENLGLGKPTLQELMQRRVRSLTN